MIREKSAPDRPTHHLILPSKGLRINPPLVQVVKRKDIGAHSRRNVQKATSLRQDAALSLLGAGQDQHWRLALSVCHLNTGTLS